MGVEGVDTSRRSVALCVAGSQAEFEGRPDDARSLFRQAWKLAEDDYDRCVAAHYVAHLEPDASEALRWNLAALTHARLADQALVEGFYGSLYVNLGHSYERTGDAPRAEEYYDLAAAHGVKHQEAGPAS